MLRQKDTGEVQHIRVYADYWLINKTGLRLTYLQVTLHLIRALYTTLSMFIFREISMRKLPYPAKNGSQQRIALKAILVNGNGISSPVQQPFLYALVQVQGWRTVGRTTTRIVVTLDDG